MGGAWNWEREWDPVNQRWNPAHRLKTAEIFDFVNRMAKIGGVGPTWKVREYGGPAPFAKPAGDVRIIRKRRVRW